MKKKDKELAEKHEQKMKQIKMILNLIVAEASPHIPIIKTPQTPTGKMIKGLFWYMNKIKDQQQPIYKHLYGENFPQFLETLEKTMLYLCELDDHYRGYIVYAFLAIHDLVESSKSAFKCDVEGMRKWINYMHQSKNPIIWNSNNVDKKKNIKGKT